MMDGTYPPFVMAAQQAVSVPRRPPLHPCPEPSATCMRLCFGANICALLSSKDPSASREGLPLANEMAILAQKTLSFDGFHGDIRC